MLKESDEKAWADYMAAYERWKSGKKFTVVPKKGVDLDIDKEPEYDERLYLLL